ncbi:hypothetical protein ES703_124900 [subsurface metagenome]
MRVFVLGAGVASSYGCPVTKDLFTEAIESSHRYQMIQKIKEVLRYTYPEFVEEDKNYPNIEEFLNLLEVWKEFNSKIERRPKYSDFDIEQVRRYVIRILVELLDTKLDNIGKNHVILKFAKCLLPNDVIITFNWDLGIESAINEMIEKDHITDWRYRLPQRTTKGDVILLKAHGSIDWFKTEDITFISHKKRFFLDDALGQISVLNSWDYPKYKGREELIPFIVPPTLGKSFQQGEIIGIWADIYRALWGLRSCRNRIRQRRRPVPD